MLALGFLKLCTGFLLSISLCKGQTVYLAGDSTMALNGMGKGTGTDGWGQYLGQYLSIPVVNKAIGGESARTYTDFGLFTAIYNLVQKGDFVIIEFGHNDGPTTPDKGKSDLTGTAYTAVQTVTATTGVISVVHTYDYYIDNALRNITKRGGIPIISSLTPDNTWINGTIAPAPVFQAYAKLSSINTKATYVDHYSYVAQAYQNLGQATVDTFYPNDAVHTSPAGANVVAEAFVRGLICGGSALAKSVNALGQTVPSKLDLLLCLTPNTTLLRRWLLMKGLLVVRLFYHIPPETRNEVVTSVNATGATCYPELTDLELKKSFTH